MSKFFYIVSLLLLGFLAIWRFIGNYLIDEGSLKSSFGRQLWVFIIISVIVGTIYFSLFKKIFPVGWQKQTGAGQLAIAAIFYVLAFAIVRQTAVSLNILLPYKQRDLFEGIIVGKSIETTGKGTKFYHLAIKDYTIDSVKQVIVSKRIFNEYREADTLRKYLFTGPFNVQYMRK